MDEDHKKLQLDSLLASYNLYRTVIFPTRISGNLASLIDNTFINTSNHTDYIICSVVNGLSDHNAQLLNLDKIITQTECTSTHNVRNINPSSTTDFKLNLSYESWDNIFLDEDVNVTFNNFLNTYLRIFNASFPTKKFLVKSNAKPWLSPGIRTSCLRKRELYLLTKHNNGPKMLNDYKLYCKVLSRVITAAKKSYYNKYISASVNRTRAAWNVVKMLTGNKYNHNKIIHMNINDDPTDNYQLIVNSFNKYFSTITDKTVSETPQYSDSTLQNMNPLDYLHKVFSQPFPQMQLKSTCIKELKGIIKSLKTKDSCGYDEISNKILKVYFNCFLTRWSMYPDEVPLKSMQ
ncbi:hypothetical protein Cfor_09168 [Coptotermes formosanus]|uniref:Endonuclease/exonuclease/phosphatase domain-containing protein n=1 Tax=Coptotermes formosanus TaxID=36987 RepID=A0A6L2PUB5_COPFO|nr:hypothetical protein Cfor_09168 [Coptotermes formosanus]